MILFVIGNWWIFTSKTCSQTSPLLYYVSFCWVVAGYIHASLPLLVCIAMIFCMPCVIIFLRRVNPDPSTGVSEEVIKCKHLFYYSSTKLNSMFGRKTKTKNKDKKKKKKKKKKAMPVENFKVGNMDPQDAMCAICLSDYTEGESIKRLKCNHHFHPKCVDEWLRVNRQ